MVISRLKWPYHTNCRDYRNYSKMNCINDCLINYYYNKYKCIPMFNTSIILMLNNNTNKIWCNNTHMIELIENNVLKTCEKNCLLDCYEEFYILNDFIILKENEFIKINGPKYVSSI